MRNLPGEFRREDTDLQRRYLDLECEWNSYKSSAPPQFRRRTQPMIRLPSVSTASPIDSPRENSENLARLLMYSLQSDDHSSETKEIDLRRAGKRLPETLEETESEKFSDCSSAVFQVNDDVVSSAGSCSPALRREDDEEVEEEKKAKGSSDGRRWTLISSVLAVVLAVLSLAGVILTVEFHAIEDGDILTPT